MDYNIRLATLNDARKLAEVKIACWETTYRGIYPDEKLDNYDVLKNAEKFETIISREDIDLYVVEVNGEIVGYMSCGVPVRSYADYEQEIGLLYLLKEFRGQGIGRELFELASSVIAMKGYDRFFISCNKYNEPAKRFYEAMGGVIVHSDDDNEDKSIPQVKYHYDIMKIGD